MEKFYFAHNTIQPIKFSGGQDDHTALCNSRRNQTKVYGYALREDGKVFIVQEDGTKVPVRAETVMPYQACHRLEDHISLTERTLAAFHEKKFIIWWTLRRKDAIHLLRSGG